MIDLCAERSSQRYKYFMYEVKQTLILCKQICGHQFRASEIVTVIYELFFQRQKMRGNRDTTFFDEINPVFVCLVASALQHCLKEWKGGDRTKVLVEFKYETAAGKNIIGRDAWDKG